MKQGSLIVAGTGIKSIAHITLETQSWIRAADLVLYCVADPVTIHWLHQQNRNCEDLHRFYQDQQPRLDTYLQMSQHIIQQVRQAQNVCALFYGHPGVFSLAAHQAIAMARAEGYRTAMLPGISAEDCLFADIGIDPAMGGCLSLEASEAVLCQYPLPQDKHVILWQVGSVGEFTYRAAGYQQSHKGDLQEYLTQHYPTEHQVFLYQASQYASCPAKIDYLPLGTLAQQNLNAVSTLYIPPLRPASIDSAAAERYQIQLPQTPQQLPEYQAQQLPELIPPPKHSALADSLADLAQQPVLLAQWRQNPQTFAELYSHLSSTEAASLASQDPSQLQQQVTQGSESSAPSQSQDQVSTTAPSPQPLDENQQRHAQQFCRSLSQHPRLALDYLQAAAEAQQQANPEKISDYLRRSGYTCSAAQLADYWRQQLPTDAPCSAPQRSLDNLLQQIAHIAAQQHLPPETWQRLLIEFSQAHPNSQDLASAVPHAQLNRLDDV